MTRWISLLLLAGTPWVARAEGGLVKTVYLEEEVSLGPAAGPLHPVGLRKTWIGTDQVRIESGEAVEIYDAARGRYLSLDRATHSLLELDATELSVAGQVPPAAALGVTVDEESGEPSVPAIAFRDTGQEERVGPWKTRVWETTEPDYDLSRDRIWLAEGAPLRWSALEEVVRRVYAGPSSLSAWFDQVRRLPGYPVQIERRGADHVIRYTVLRMEPVRAESSLFTRPAGYRQRLDPTGLPSLP